MTMTCSLPIMLRPLYFLYKILGLAPIPWEDNEGEKKKCAFSNVHVVSTWILFSSLYVVSIVKIILLETADNIFGINDFLEITALFISYTVSFCSHSLYNRRAGQEILKMFLTLRSNDVNPLCNPSVLYIRVSCLYSCVIALHICDTLAWSGTFSISMASFCVFSIFNITIQTTYLTFVVVIKKYLEMINCMLLKFHRKLLLSINNKSLQIKIGKHGNKYRKKFSAADISRIISLRSLNEDCETLCDIIFVFNSTFGLSVGCCLVRSLMSLIFVSFINVAILLGIFNGTQFLRSVMIVWAVFYSSFIAAIAWSCHSATSAAANTTSLLFNLTQLQTFMDAKTKNQLRLFLQMQADRHASDSYVFTAGGCLVLNGTILLKAAVTIATYLAILVQTGVDQANNSKVIKE